MIMWYGLWLLMVSIALGVVWLRDHVRSQRTAMSDYRQVLRTLRDNYRGGGR